MPHDLWNMFAKLAMGALMLGLIAGCTVNTRSGVDFDPTIVSSTLKLGSATQADVRAALGEPFAKGSAMMPFHDRPHLTWTYFAERSTVSTGSGNMDERLEYLFVFFDGDRMDSYLWFDSAMR
ncbi:MAG TPA: hypothetical protein VMU87_20815 [Stellaceae bacterium]|nr:hypothetical protein [Stellaceae bacterium]